MERKVAKTPKELEAIDHAGMTFDEAHFMMNSLSVKSQPSKSFICF